MFICISYIVLSFGNSWKNFLKVSESTVQLNGRLNSIICLILYIIFANCNNRLDYCGIALLIMGSFVPWLYYGFYCHYEHKLVYLSVVLVLGVLSIIVSLDDKFSTPSLRPLRTGASQIESF